ncbi:MAG TPA: hypothetical protein VHW23_31060 [Kofleriaceae bacterium]|jgi:hypothetical protein|nr:hypothetical protein [Kofleriaceae bacterium]
MKMMSLVLCLVMTACGTVDNRGGGPGDSTGVDGGGGGGSGGGTGSGGHPTDSCLADDCVCPPGENCFHACTAGGVLCRVQGAPGADTNVHCNAAEGCHVECGSGTSCEVDCNGSPECHVSCPAAGCTVSHCVDPTCDVTCGLTSPPMRVGTTVLCQ